MRRLRTGLILIACAAGLALPATASADSYFLLHRMVRDLDVRANHVAWTVGDGRGRFRLRGGFAETAHDLPVRPASSFRGIDLGTDRRGHTVLVYARCPRVGRLCDVYLYNPRSRREHRLASVSRASCSETSPHVDRGVLVFVRRRSHRHHCSGGLFLKPPGAPIRRVMRRAPVAYDFAGRLIAFQRQVPSPSDGSRTSEIRLLRVGHHRSRVVVAAKRAFLSRPRLDGGLIYWRRAVKGAGERDDILRRAIRDGPTTALERAGRSWIEAAGPARDNLTSFAVYGPRLFYLFGGIAGHSGFPIGRVDPAPAFR